MIVLIVTTAASTAVVLYLFVQLVRKPKRLHGPLPPVVPITESRLSSDGRQALQEAFAQFGPVIGIRRSGRVEYVVGHEYAHTVLTRDDVFSFDAGLSMVLNTKPLKFIGQNDLFGDLGRVIRDGMLPRADTIVQKLAQQIEGGVCNVLDCVDGRSESREMHDPSSQFRLWLTEAMLPLIFGKKFGADKFVQSFVGVSAALESLLCINNDHNNSTLAKRLPRIYKAFAWIKFAYFILTNSVFKDFCSHVLQDLATYRHPFEIEDESNEVPLLHTLTQHYLMANDSQSLSIGRRMWILLIGVGSTFASVHTTAQGAVWVMFYLAQRREYIPKLREELRRISRASDSRKLRLTVAELREAHYCDSFIREVLRCKGDTLTPCRMATRDVILGEYLIPQGHMISTFAADVHENEVLNGPGAHIFDGLRWAGSGKTASMASVSYIAFGYGRAACPGRVVAIHQLKLILFAIIAQANPSLRGNCFTVEDAMNMITVAPSGVLVLNTDLDPVCL